ncbi:hypothetical protein PoB_002539600 [Plakobranchus ocellatus]|uniref:Secreted protein n=1 Tax=Plakobranchus ocellatus TaxID=259542 RepID=A0AAV3ZWH4_9GAST|nr:hypothetical protein PoB_002539600 [Plakobranchus ocellatus]
MTSRVASSVGPSLVLASVAQWLASPPSDLQILLSWVQARALAPWPEGGSESLSWTGYIYNKTYQFPHGDRRLSSIPSSHNFSPARQEMLIV